MGLLSLKLHQAIRLLSAYFSACMHYLSTKLTLKIKCLEQCLPTQRVGQREPLPSLPFLCLSVGVWMPLAGSSPGHWPSEDHRVWGQGVGGRGCPESET